MHTDQASSSRGQQTAYLTAQSGGMTASAMQTQSVLESAVSGAHTALHELSAVVDALAGRLQSVMSPEVPVPANGVGKSLNAVDQPHSAMVNDLANVRHRVQGLTDTVNSLLLRLET